ncbi:MAG TPA: hypothetical protein DCS21_00875, partial [Gammaproteobacteria bacterium]|nr:hypothetical protein [Gammaproteobacteria bacterium]
MIQAHRRSAEIDYRLPTPEPPGRFAPPRLGQGGEFGNPVILGKGNLSVGDRKRQPFGGHD